MFEHIGTAVRLRYRAGATFGLGDTRRWYLVGNDEILFYANKTKGRDAGFSENRTFVGIGRKLTPNISLEAGWQPCLINSAGKKGDILRHYLVTYLTMKIPYKPAKPAPVKKVASLPKDETIIPNIVETPSEDKLESPEPTNEALEVEN